MNSASPFARKNAFHLLFTFKSPYELVAVSIVQRVSVRNHIDTVPGMKWNTDFAHDLGDNN